MNATETLSGRAIGIIGGIGPQASARLHTRLVQKATVEYNERGLEFPQIVHFSVRVPPFFRGGEDEWRAVDIVSRAARSLLDAGASTIGLACNTAHILLPEVEARTGVRVERIPEQVRRVVSEQNLSRVGLLATQETIDRGLYDAVAEVADIIVPDREFNATILEHIVRVFAGTYTGADSQAFREIVERFRDENRLEAVILGCTELPVAYGDGPREGIVDSIEVLADHLLTTFHGVYVGGRE
ncbi:aspartate/glutamate racemase family protein [Peribacillus butanolivorans]|uniref:aspartate/glutamate racemase family protein n=1 Tax=Peribacillus butanolivorans TaxID=421767 RepID=UPI003665A299